MSEEQGAAPACPHPEAVGTRWGDPISEERQAELKALADKQREWAATPEAERGGSPVEAESLDGAQVFWLAAYALAGLDGEPAAAAGRLRNPDESDSEKPYELVLPDLHLEEAVLLEVHLEGAYLRGAHLEHAHLEQAHLEGAVLRGAHLERAYLGGFLGGAHLEQADLAEAHLERANLIGAHLDGAYITVAHLERADLSGAHLEKAQLVGSSLGQAVLRRARLEGAYLWGADLERADLHEAHLEGAYLYPNDGFEGAHLEGADLRTASFDKTSRLKGAVLTGASFDQVDFDNTNLTVVDWSLVGILGDEVTARKPKGDEGKQKDSATRLDEWTAAVRANRQLATALRDQGLNEDADRFAYRAQFLQRQVLRRQRKFSAYVGSVLLDAVSGYGYRPVRSLITYVLVVVGFALAYYLLGPVAHLQLEPQAALVFSITSFHGRGFAPGANVGLTNPITELAALEAIIGLLIEITFIATFTQRFFAR